MSDEPDVEEMRETLRGLLEMQKWESVLLDRANQLLKTPPRSSGRSTNDAKPAGRRRPKMQ